MNKTTLLMVGILGVVAILSAGLALVPVQCSKLVQLVKMEAIQASVLNKIKVTNVVVLLNVVTTEK